jgi:ubiquinone/menaquinone biosynthesis C-methylase UbiE
MSESSSRAERVQRDAVACFDRWAEDYDRSFLSRHIRRIQKRIVQIMNPAQNAFILDVGCGTGEGIRYLHRFVKKGLLAGLDISPRMIEVAQRKFSDRTAIELKVGEADNLPWPDCTFDLAMTTFTLHHCPHPDRALYEMERVLKPGGRLFLVDLIFPRPLDRPLNWILRLAEGADLRVQTSDSARQLFRKAHLHLISFQRLVPLIFLFMAQKESAAAKEKGTEIC